MNHRKRPARMRTLPAPRVGVLGGLVVAVLVGLLAIATTWAVTDDGGGTSSATRNEQAQPGGGSEETGGTDDEPGSDTAGEGGERLEKSVRRFRAAQRRLAERVSKRLARRTAPFEFGIASLNVLGASHTGPGGNKPAYYPDASTRMNIAIGALRANSIDVVGFQEFEASQYGMFSSRAGEYSLYPGLSLGEKSVRFNIAWRTSAFQLVEARTLSIPYAGGSRIAMPVVLLESTATKRRAWFANFHNPADTPNLGNNARWRAEAAGIELAYLSELHQQDGTPVLVTGDFNERAEIFCRFTESGVFSAAAGGSNSGGCAPPPNMQVDWVFGSTGVSFAGYAATDIGRASDHNLVNARATLVGVE